MVQPGNTGDHTEKLRESNAANVEAVVNTVEERLANLNKITSDTGNQADDIEENEDPTPEDKEQDGGKDAKDDDKDGNQAGEGDDSDESTPGKDDDSSKEGQDDKILPPAFLRAAIHRGWKEDDAKEFFKENADAAIRTFQNCYMDVNNASREWARIGKAKADAGSNQVVASDARPRPEKIDVDKLVKDYDLDDAVVEQLREQQKTIDAIEQEPVVPSQPPQPQQQQSGGDPNVQLEINNFFGSEVLNDYSEFYGALKMGQNWSDLGGGQYDNRWAVLQQADLIILGAEASGMKMEPLDALERAHMIVSEPVREQAVREGLKKTATKRKKSMTIRPSDGTRSSKKTTSDAGGNTGSRSKEELVTAVQDKMDHLFNS